MIRNRIGVRPALLPGLLLLCFSLQPAPAWCAEGVTGKWTSVRGRVGVTRAGSDATRLARGGDPVAVGDLVKTENDARAQALLADDTVLMISPGSSLQILQYAFEAASGRRSAVIKVIDGRVRFIVGARKNSRFNVESPHAAISATAADFVTVVAPEETTVVVLEGNARVKNTSNLVIANADLWANQSTGVRKGAAPSQPAQITPQQRKEYRSDARLFR